MGSCPDTDIDPIIIRILPGHPKPSANQEIFDKKLGHQKIGKVVQE